jgi:hypothetical protein
MKQSLTIALVCAAGILILTSCRLLQQPTATPLEQLVAIVEDPDSPDFWFATSELAKMGPAAAPAAPSLARALRYPRRDSYMAGKALVAIGPAAEPAIPELIEALKNDRPIVRSDAAFVLGVIGESSKCAVPEIAQLLWDPDLFVRGAAAVALDAISGVDLVAEVYELKPSHPGRVVGDEPEGTITEKARAWWIEEGQYLIWSGESGLCNPSSP